MKIEPCRDLSKLHPFVQKVAGALLAECKKQGLNIGISETFRSIERQNYLYAQGRTRSGNIITNARGSYMASYHQWGLAFDVYNNVPGDLYNPTVINKVGAIGQKMGLEWGGSWRGFVDTPHFQYTFGLSIADLKAGNQPPIAVKGDEEVVKEINIKLNGVIKKVETIVKDGHNFVKLQDIGDYWIKIDYDSAHKLPIIEVRASN